MTAKLRIEGRIRPGGQSQPTPPPAVFISRDHHAEISERKDFAWAGIVRTASSGWIAVIDGEAVARAGADAEL